VCCSTDYDYNMSKAGPEKLISAPHCLGQMLRQAGLWEGEKTDKILERLCELSLASMDIESRTVDLDNRNPKPGKQMDYAEVNSSGLVDSHPLKVQKPLMIAHVDALARERAEKPGIRILLICSSPSEAIPTKASTT